MLHKLWLILYSSHEEKIVIYAINSYFSSMMLAGEVGRIGAAEGSLDMQLDLRDWENFHENLLKKTNILSLGREVLRRTKANETINDSSIRLRL